MLEIPVEELRALVRERILEVAEDAANLPITCYQPADILLLRMMARERRAA